MHSENQAIRTKILIAFLFAQALHKHRRAKTGENGAIDKYEIGLPLTQNLFYYADTLRSAPFNLHLKTMADLSDPHKVLKNLKYISHKGGLDALNYILTQHKYISTNRRNYYLQYFIQEKISSIMLVDKQKLEELKEVRKAGRMDRGAIPHSHVTEDFLDILIAAMLKSRLDNFFEYEKNQLFLVIEEQFRKPVEKVLRQMGLKIDYFRGVL